MITLCLMVIAGLVALAAAVQVWYLLFAAGALAVILIVWLVRRSAKKKPASSAPAPAAEDPAEQLRREFGLPTQTLSPSSAPEPPARTILRFDEDPPRPVPAILDGCVPVYRYDDVQLAALPAPTSRAKINKPVDLVPGDGVVQVLQSGERLGDLPEGRLPAMAAEWIREGRPLMADLLAYKWDPRSAVIRLVFFRDERARLRGVKGSFGTRLNAIPDALAEDLPGQICRVSYDTERPRYDVICGDARIGSLPPSAVDRIRAGDREPEDVTVCVDRFDETDGRLTLYVVIA